MNRITVIYGPMTAGKTTKLLSMASEYVNQTVGARSVTRVYYLKPEVDTRAEYWSTHNPLIRRGHEYVATEGKVGQVIRTRISSLMSKGVYQIIGEVLSDPDLQYLRTVVIAADEVQFYSVDDASLVLGKFCDPRRSAELPDMHKLPSHVSLRFILCGLMTDWRQNPWGVIPLVIPFADEVHALQTWCRPCLDAGNMKKAYYTSRRSTAAAQIMVGKEDYIATCPECAADFIRWLNAKSVTESAPE